MAKNKKDKEVKKDKRGRKPHIEIDEIEKLYQVINKAQTEEEATYIYFTDQNLNSVAENIFRDAKINYEKSKCSHGTMFKLLPSKIEMPDINIDTDFFEDEITEDGNVF